MDTKKMTPEERDRCTLDCGHRPSKHGENTTGTAHHTMPDGTVEEVCWECGDRMQVADLLTEKRFFTYIRESPTGGWLVTTWSGGKLGDVTHHHEVENAWVKRGWMCSRWYYVRVRDVHGQLWFGYTGGPSLYVRLRKLKDQGQSRCA